MAVIDIVLGAFILFGLIRGFMKGLFVELASLLALIAGIYGAMHFSNYAADFLQSKTDWSEKTITITAFTLTFIIIVITIVIAGKALTKLADFTALGILNKLLGGVFGALKMALVLSVVLNIFDKINKTADFIDETDENKYILYNPVKSFAPMIFPNLFELKEVITNTLQDVE